MTGVRRPAAAVVVYNRFCGESQTCRALAEMTEPRIPVVIYDNSTRDFRNEQFCREQGWTYLGGGGNVGISKAYNACIRQLRQDKNIGLLCLFDDDTQVSPEYFTLLQQAAAGPGKIFVPFIYAGGQLLSPCILDAGHKSRRFADEAAATAYRGDRMSAINSGMAVDLSLFENYQYDEHIFLDGVDHHFLQDMKRRGEGIHVFPYRCTHEFSGTEKPPLQAALFRFRIFVRDYRYILKDAPGAFHLLIGKRALKLCLQYRTVQFLNIWLKAGDVEGY